MQTTLQAQKAQVPQRENLVSEVNENLNLSQIQWVQDLALRVHYSCDCLAGKSQLRTSWANVIK